MELLIIGLAVGGLLGSKGKTMVKAAAKGYLAVAERTREMSHTMREDFRDAVEEARYEHDQRVVNGEEAGEPATETGASAGTHTMYSAEVEPGVPTTAPRKKAAPVIEVIKA